MDVFYFVLPLDWDVVLQRSGSTESLPLSNARKRKLRRQRLRDRLLSLEHSPRPRSMSGGQNDNFE